jgi:DNA-binding NtrC family response regulator/tetratricopeptide (TPR) repeat protein
VQLLADRFIAPDDQDLFDSIGKEHRVIDLSSGEEVTVITSVAGGPSDQLRWTIRCDGFFRLHHRAIAALVDYGLVGQTHRFEAWRCGSAWRGADAEADRVLKATKLFLHANRRSGGQVSAGAVRTWRGRASVLPDRAAGYEIEPDRPDRPPAADAGPLDTLDLDIDACGIATIERRAVAAVAEVLAQASGARPRVIAVAAPPGSGGSVAVREVARVARQHGVVPLAFEGAEPSLLDLLRGRTLCLIDRRGGRHGWQRLVEWAITSPKPHVLLHVGPDDVPNVRAIQLEGVAEETLISAIRPAGLSGASRGQIERAARHAHGLPGRFAQALWGKAPVPRPVLLTTRRPVAAEQIAVYGDDIAPASSIGIPPASACWPAPGELGALRRRLDGALALVERGRHAPADRALRSVVGCLARRHDWSHAARGALALASSLLRRGRARDVHSALDEAREYAVKGGGEAALQTVAVVSGQALVDQGRLDEAESVLHAAFGAARSCGDPDILVSSAFALARCLFWRGRYSEAEPCLESVATAGLSDPAVVIRLAIVRSRLAIGRRDLSAGMGLALTALERAEQANPPHLVADAAYALAFAHLWAGDLSAVERDVAVCLRASRSARNPLRALKARVMAAEAARRAGRSAAVPALVARARRLPLPATVRGRVSLLEELVSTSHPRDAIKRHVAATGLPALALYAPADADWDQPLTTAFDAAVDILRLCQSAEDEAALLPEICARIRPRLQAAGVAFFAADGLATVPLAADGNRIDPAMGARVIAARQPIPPYQQDERLEGGAPVRYGGDTLGAVVARWTIAMPPDVARAQMLLTMIATAVGPAFAAALARRRQPPQAHPGELLGTSASMADVRAAIERAAAAPFAVLVEGESGCGKELVARALHRRSTRRDRPFCTLNCAALPDDLVEAELFGHARGAFTGAVAERPGVFEEAHTGTLFLDEIGDLSPRAQAKVLRTVQEGELRRVGENVARRIDVRIVSATNQDLRQDAAAHRFRLDLLYRLDVIRITVPPLRDRREDIALLAEHFWREATERVGSRAVLSAAAVAALARYDWPGNVRELQNVLAALAVRSPKRGVVPPTALPPPFHSSSAVEACRLDAARRTFEERFVRAALVRAGGHRTRAAQELGVSRQGLVKLMSRLQISD